MIRVVIQDEDGSAVSQGVDVKNEVLVHTDDARFTCLRFIDPYGDTVFNCLQLALLLEDLRLLRKLYDVARHEEVIRQVEALVEEAQAEPHRYLKVIGD
jgi:hypothetical protein